MTRIGGVIADSGIAVDDLGLERPSLDDVFLHLTGHRAEDEDDAEGTKRRARARGGIAMTSPCDRTASRRRAPTVSSGQSLRSCGAT